ncbi:hypothetical protein LTR85_011690 [Meristemomyces frigidus]|nr:hypothetical protein LTR85_011690 [Meristemomyces frigidus]
MALPRRLQSYLRRNHHRSERRTTSDTKGVRKGTKCSRCRKRKQLKAKSKVIPAPSPLLTLPAELRNSIWEYVAAEPDRILVTPSLVLPPWLSTCKQIRQEAQKLWYTSNTFQFVIIDLDTSLVSAWCLHTCSRSINGLSPVILNIFESHNWTNLVAWAKKVWEGGHTARLLEIDGFASKTEAVVSASHCIAVEYMDLTWDDCERALGNLRLLIARFDGGWGLSEGA